MDNTRLIDALKTFKDATSYLEDAWSDGYGGNELTELYPFDQDFHGISVCVHEWVKFHEIRLTHQDHSKQS